MSERTRKSKQCSALDGEGRRCRKKAVVGENYHGNNELYGYFSGRPEWVRVWFCEYHRCFGGLKDLK
jgi:hypothetical protein